MKPDGTGERILTEGFHNEGPTFSPNGLFVMFFRDPGRRVGRAKSTWPNFRPRRVHGADARLRLGPGLGTAAELRRRKALAKVSGNEPSLAS